MQRVNHPTYLNNPKASPNNNYLDDDLSAQKKSILGSEHSDDKDSGLLSTYNLLKMVKTLFKSHIKHEYLENKAADFKFQN